MHAYIVISDVEPTDDEIRKIIPAARLILRVSIEKIADTRELIKQTNVSAYKNTVYLLENFDKASPEAQNAFLKRLEEPQENISFVLHTRKEANILPTILSRCQKVKTSKKLKQEVGNLDEVKEFIASEIPARYAQISKITKREDARAFLEGIINSLHEDISEHPEYKDVLKAADETLNRINRNANPTLQLTNFAISF